MSVITSTQILVGIRHISIVTILANFRNCKYQDKGCTNRKTGCLEGGNAESPVCYCTDEEKVDDRPHRVCDENPQQKGVKSGQRGFYSQGDGTVCEEMMPTKAALLTCSKQDGDGICTKAVMTAELMQDMLIKQAQQVIQMANSLLTNKKFQLVDVTNPGQNIPTSQIDGCKSQTIQTSRIEVRSQNMQTASSRSTQPVALNDNPNLNCRLQNIHPSDAIGQPSSKIVQNCMCEPLPRPPLIPSQPGTYQEDDIGEAQYQSQTLHRPFGESAHAIYNSNKGMGSNKPSKGVPSTHSMGAQVSYQVGSTGHICIPRDALLQDPMNPKLCIPLSFNPQLPVNCPFVNDRAPADGSVIIDPGSTEQNNRRSLQKQNLAQGSNRSLKQGSHHGLQKETSQGSHRLQQPSSRLGLNDISQKNIPKESSATGQLDKRHQLQATSGRSLQEGSSKRIKKGSSRRDLDRDRHRRYSDRERPRRESARDRPRRDSDRERRKRELSSLEKNGNVKQPKPRRESMDSEDIAPSQRRRKRSTSPCDDKNRSSAGKRRPSPSEMVRTLNNYETDLLQAMDKVKGKYLKERGNETSSSRGKFCTLLSGLNRIDIF